MQNETLNALETAVTHHRAGRFTEAEAIYGRVLTVEPRNPDALHLLGLILEQRGEVERAAALIGQSVTANPGFANAQESLLRVLRALGRTAEAVAPAEALAALRPDSLSHLTQFGDLLLETGQAERAAIVFRDALVRQPDDAGLLFKLGEALLALADLPGALEEFRAAVIRQPSFAAAFERFDMVRRELETAAALHATLTRNRERAGPHTDRRLCTIYIKGYSRPFYIDRLIRSIGRCVRNHGPIVLLNDGIGEVYTDKLKRDHPHLEIRNSPKVEGGVIAAPAGDRYHERKAFYRSLDFFDPARFWVREIRKDPNDYIVYLDEDVWFFRDIDLEGMVESLRANGALGALLLYQKANLRAARQQRDPTVHQDPAGCGAVMDYYAARVDSLDYAEGYRINPGTITLKDYWINAYEDCLHFADEMHQNRKTLQLFTVLSARIPELRMGILDGGAIKHSSSSTARPDAGGKILTNRISPDVFHDLLSQHWLEGRLDTMADLPNDFSIERLVGLMRGHVPEEQIAAWVEWQRDFVRMYHWLD